MVQTQNSENNNSPDPIATQLAAIAAKLEAIKTIKEDIAALKEGSRSSGSKNFEGEVLGWVENSIGPIRECFRCGDKYEPGLLCKTGTLKVLEANEDVEEPL
nr:retrotransposon Gag domain, retroviral aspartyl protease [Tanacetum cinerariifolium]